MKGERQIRRIFALAEAKLSRALFLLTKSKGQSSGAGYTILRSAFATAPIDKLKD